MNVSRFRETIVKLLGLWILNKIFKKVCNFVKSSLEGWATKFKFRIYNVNNAPMIYTHTLFNLQLVLVNSIFVIRQVLTV